MANNKHAAAKPVRSTSYLPKAGPKSKSGGRNHHKNGAVAQMTTRSQQDYNLIDARRQETHAAREAEIIAFQDAQVNRALDSKLITDLAEGSVELTVAISTIVWFPKVAAVRKDGKIIKTRTDMAVEMALEELDYSQLKQKNRVQFGINRARQALREAFDALKS